MPPELPDTRHRNPRQRVVEVMTAAQEDAMAQLRREGIPEAQALALMQRISSFAVHTLRELDHLYREFEDLLAHDPDRSAAHQEWFDTKVGGMLLSLESFIDALVAEALNKTKEEYRQQVSQQKEAVTLPARPAPAARGAYPVWMLIVWMIGIATATLFAWQGSASLFWAGIGLLVPLLLWLKVGKSGWGLLFPLTGIGMEAYAVLWHLIVEGGFP
jgi:hypothetical protein